MITIVRWRKSSYSGSGANNCVECAEVDPRWRKSSYSGSGASNCVECAELGPSHAVRDSKNPDGPHLVLPPTAWQAFMNTTKG